MTLGSQNFSYGLLSKNAKVNETYRNTITLVLRGR
jgi:hypothetical protein